MGCGILDFSAKNFQTRFFFWRSLRRRRIFRAYLLYYIYDIYTTWTTTFPSSRGTPSLGRGSKPRLSARFETRKRHINKLYRARSRLYRRQILQVNTRWKALDEIYKIYMLLHRSDLNILEMCRQTFVAFFGKFLQKFSRNWKTLEEVQNFANFQKICIFLSKICKSLQFLKNSKKIWREFLLP